jgi:hypothetical protein
LDRLRNTALREVVRTPVVPEKFPTEISGTLQEVPTIQPPKTLREFIFNFDHSDLTPVMITSGHTEELSPLGSDQE